MESTAPRTPSLCVPLAFAAAGLLAHMLTNGRYGYFRDELYYFAGGDHLAWGYVDHAPLIALAARLSRLVLGDGLHAVRFLPALSSGLMVLLTGMIARELGGRSFAMALACLCVLLAPVFVVTQTVLNMNAFEPLFWMGCALVLARVLRDGNPRRLVWFGVLAGIGLENKHSMVFFGFALAAGLLFTQQRRLFATRWLWIAGIVALLLLLPNLAWQYQHGWPTLEDLSNVRATHKNVESGPLAFMGRQILLVNPVAALVWGAGLWWLLRNRIFRPLGLAYLVLLAVMMGLHGKDYYMAPAYPLLFAAGGVMWEGLAAWPRRTLAAAVAVSGAALAPMGLPLLEPATLVSYLHALHLEVPPTEVEHAGPLPQHFGDMFGWPEMVEQVAAVYRALPPAERAKAGILAGNYGEAGAIDFFGPRYGLPKAISGHQTYYYWGPRNYTGEVLILLHFSRRRAESACASVEDGPQVASTWGMAEERYRILVCRGLHPPLAELWPRLKHWN